MVMVSLSLCTIYSQLRWLKVGFNKRWDIKRAKMRNEVSFDQLILVSDQSLSPVGWLAGRDPLANSQSRWAHDSPDTPPR